MKINYSNKCTITQYTEEERDKIFSICTGKNPEYNSWQFMVQNKPYLRYAKGFPEPPKELYLALEDNNKIIAPRAIIDKLAVTANTFDLISIPCKFDKPKFTLYEDQRKAVDALLKYSRGILVAPTGAGKTVCGLTIAIESKQKTLFLVHSKVLLQQTVAEIKSKLGITPGIITSGKNTDGDIVVATIQSFYKKDPKDYVNKYGTIILDECLTGDSLISTRNGRVPIGDSSILNEEVLSYDVYTNTWQYSKVLNWVEKSRNPILNIKTSQGLLKCTEDHKILTSNGWKQAKDLKPIIDSIILPRDRKLSKLLRKILTWVDKLLEIFN